ncbi:Putative RNA binding domain protein [[Torrubiella] hemipterigena]|uniref:Putative RNA binding domain protein n=1 Tax=[Torrubiella] hemipterigena TaxID=1531966 RepID=A0A0A1TLC7_9HYPO|nr:Putative RNA binding domain protein [[Torrubiella] hemipterigena]
MNQIRAIQKLNQQEIENGISPEGSWHVDYRDTAFIYFGGLPYELTEGDVITIFSQYGEPTFLKLVRDKETGKSKGFGWLKYENQKSTDLAVDNLGGAEIGGRLVKVDHARYQGRDDEDQDEFKVGWEDIQRREGKPLSDDESSEDERRPILPEEIELAKLIQNHDDDDPMKGFLIEEKKKEVEEARAKAEKKESRHHHRHRSHRSRSSKDKDRHERRRSRSPADREHLSRHGDSRSSREHRSHRDGHESRRDKRDDKSRSDRRHQERSNYDDDKRRRHRHDDDSDQPRDSERRGHDRRRRSRTRSPHKSN